MLGSGFGGDQRTLVWVDRQGTEEPLAAEPLPYESPRVSPDGRSVVLQIDSGADADVVVYDLERNTPSRVTFDSGADVFPIWTPDGQRVVFSSDREGVQNLYSKAADGTGQAERLTTSETIQLASSWSVDGQTLVFHGLVGANVRVGTLPLDDPSQTESLLAAGTHSYDAYPEVSPDGRWLAYHSNESGQYEVYVRPFPNVDDGRWQISPNGGFSPVWGPDGRELFYRGLNRGMTVVTYETDPTFRAGNPEVLFPAPYLSVGPTRARPFDLAPDGRFLMIRTAWQTAADAPPLQISVVLNWFEELTERVPVP